ncbi:MAG: sugar phosphate isomerase/epimerase [Bacteroidota bacterium]|nr:sugar phosphate isomerase/epimerase [Flavisolibacter sp.]MBD0351334.1 sugar phosphate isomerase/epimerase [Flavisolibacter sp.]MBD0366804.1 sugar phosphate isomerase/epimerase [Flavisolibacter sp.]MBD0376140.1 sugar phosphate isomerase/epimerase [Flavisolibacter sp.]MDQ3843977.1 sugar phosphate isomerase/epimerase [Bacteroidota bacterium]
MLTRRRLLTQAALLTALTPLQNLIKAFAAEGKRKFKIGACDWSIGKDSDIAAFDVAKQIGVDGIMVNMGSVKNNLHLREKEVQQSYIEASRRTGVKISSLAIGELNNIPYKSDPRTEEWVWDSIDVARSLGVPVILLAFFSKNDLRNDEQGKKEVISRLKKVAPKAEKEGIILGVESYLNAAEHLEIIEQVGSKNVKAYVDFRNTADAGYDVLKEVKQLGRNNICELHMKENGFLLGKGTLPWPQIRDLIYEMGYYGDGWMQIEWSMPKGADVVESYKHNLQFLKDLFNKKI